MAATLLTGMTGSIRLYVTEPLAEGGNVTLAPPQAHYLANVMRRGPGATVLLFNGRDGEFGARIVTIGRGTATVNVMHRTRDQTSEPDLWLAFALLKRDATDLVVQKATELGVAELLPVVTERSNTHRMNADRLSSIAVEAAEQSERLTVPILHGVQPLSGLLASWPASRPLFAAMERVKAPPIARTSDPVGLLIGPEGGFSPDELDGLRAHPFVTPISLGPRILRAETACIAGLALLQGMDGR